MNLTNVEKDRADKLARKKEAHNVWVVKSIETGETLRYSICVAQPKATNHGSFGPTHTEDEEAKLIHECTNYSAAVRIQRGLERWSPKAVTAEPHEFSQFQENMPHDPRERASVFRAMSHDEQETVVYAAMCTSGLTIEQIASWLCVKRGELDHISTEVVEAAKAELQGRIAKQMVFFAFQNKSPNASTATMYLTKALIGWSDGREKVDESKAASKPMDININVVSNTNPQVTELRYKLNDMVEASEAAALKRLT